MPVKIRLQRHGKKSYAFYHIVIADGRAPRDGKFIEKLGTYNPNTNPATIELDNDSALKWLKNGAQPTETARAILSYRGIMMKLHLDKGVVKGAMTQEQADAKFEKWLSDKSAKIDSKVNKLAEGRTDYYKKRMEDEVAKNKAREAALLVKNSPVAEEVEAVAEVEAPEAQVEAPVAEVESPAVEVETSVAETEEPIAEPTPLIEVPAIEETPSTVETPVAEVPVVEDAPVAEAPESEEKAGE
jgi:small subunit ribosomal protein S16